MTDTMPRALPVVANERSLPYWEALSERGRLEILRCLRCRRFVHYPRARCPSCWSSELAPEEVSGRGRLVTWTVAHRPTAPQLQELVPFTVGVVELEEQPGLHVVAWLSGIERERLTVGLPVEAIVVETTERPLVAFVAAA